MIEQHEKTIRFSQAPTIQAEWCRADLLFELLGEQAGRHMDVEPSLRSVLLSFDLGEVPYDETISHVASKYWLDARKEETGFTIAVPAERKRRELYDRAASARPAPAEQEPAEMTPENRASLEKWIAGKLGEIAELAASGPRSACEYRIAELGWVNGTYRRATISEGRRQLEARADLPRDVRHLVELELLALEGNVLARDVERLLDAHRFDDVPAAIDRLDAFLARAPREKLAWGREYFSPQLEGEARQLRKELTLRRELWTRLRADIIITAIVLEPEPSRCAAIINDRVYRVGDELRGADGKAVAGLKVVKIVDRRVKLSLDGVEFFRLLLEK